MDRIKPEDQESFLAELWQGRTTRDPDLVPQSVVDEEMSMFAAFTRQNETLGGMR